MNLRSILVGAFAALFTLFPCISSANDADDATLLTVSKNGQVVLELNLNDFLERDSVTFTTSTNWTEGELTFTGLSLKALIEELGIETGTLRSQALNDFAIEVPVEDGIEGGPIIAYYLNGETMSVRDKGPLWIVYPYDLDPKYQSEVYFARSIWQLDRIEILE